MASSGISKNRKTGTTNLYPTQNGVALHAGPKSSHAAAVSALAESTDGEIPRIPWCDMNIKDLHSYRHAHRLNTSSSYINPQAHLIFADAARKGLNPPAIVVARRKRQELKKNRKETITGQKERSSSRLKGAVNGSANTSSSEFDEHGRQTKEQLAMAVRRHFNAMSVSEGETLARFTYVVKHTAGTYDGDQDNGFRMRFKP